MDSSPAQPKLNQSSLDSSESVGLMVLWVGMVFTLLVATLLKENVASIDLWGKLAIPAITLQSGRFPLMDDFSFTASGFPWTDHEWLSGYAFYYALLWGGDVGLTVLKLVCLMVSLLGVFVCTRRDGIPAWLVSALVLLGGSNALITGFLTTGRPQVFTFAFFPWFLYWLGSFLEGVQNQTAERKPFVKTKPGFTLLFMGLLGFFWGNLHAGFVVGLGILILACLYLSLRLRRAHRLFDSFYAHVLAHGHWLYPLAFIVGVSFNPYGWAYWHYIFYAITLDRQGVTEWAPVNWGNAYFFPAVLLLIILMVSLLGDMMKKMSSFRRSEFSEASQQRAKTDCLWKSVFEKSVFQWLLFCTIAFFGFRYMKHQPLFVLGGICVGSTFLWLGLQEAIASGRNRFKGFHQISRQYPFFSKFLGVLIPVFGIAYGFWQLAQEPHPLQVSLNRIQQIHHRTNPYPLDALRYLESLQNQLFLHKNSQHEAHLITPFSWGEYAFWALYPHYKISLDGRLEAVYPMRLFHEHRSVYLDHRIQWTKAESIRMIAAKRSPPAEVFLLTETQRIPKRSFHVSFKETVHRKPSQWRLCYQDPAFSVFQAMSLRHSEKGFQCPLKISESLSPEAAATATVFYEALNEKRFQDYVHH